MPSFRESRLESFFTLKGILIMRSIFGYYYKFSNSVPISLLLKLYCIACCIIIWCHIFVWSEVNSRAVFYDVTLLIEITINMLISLFVEDEFSTLNDLIASLPTKQNLRLTYAVIICTIIEQVTAFTYGRSLFTAEDAALYMFQYISCTYSRLSLIYQAHNNEKAIKTLCDSLKDKIEDMNMDAAEKRGHVEKFIDTFKQIINFSFDAKCQVMKFKVIQFISTSHIFVKFKIMQ
ncbi:hypothetical protein B5X24_HaOG200814 [Helicoverpa armigera]|nr:hypothetical protein B5X24_HaOG200814 [Helicoverpa armigera]